MTRIAAAVLILMAVAVGCFSARIRRAEQRCDSFVAALRTDALPRLRPHLAAAPGLAFEAVQFGFTPIDPHGGPRPCWLAALVPGKWQAHPTPDAPGLLSTDDAGASWSRIEWLGGSFAADEWPAFIERTWLAPRRREVVRDEASERSHVLVTRDDAALVLLMLRWHPPQPGYIRCEARLTGAAASALPAFEAACATALALWWEEPG